MMRPFARCRRILPNTACKILKTNSKFPVFQQLDDDNNDGHMFISLDCNVHQGYRMPQ